MDYLKIAFKPFQCVPIFYYFDENTIVDYLVITDWQNPLCELKNWIDGLY